MRKVLSSGWLTSGKNVEMLENAFAEMVGTKAAIAVNSCTAGLHSILVAKGIKPGDEVVEVTATVDYALWKNVITRFEYRWDHDLKADKHFGQGTRDNDHLLALNVIYKF